MKRPDRLAVGRVAATWWLPTVIACAVGALYVCYSVAQWRALVVPSWDLGIFAEAVQAYSRFEAPIVPIKGPGYNLLGDHFHPILALLGPVYRLFPSALTLLVVQDVLIAVSVLPVARLAQRLFGRGGAVIVGLGYGLGWGLQGAVGAQFHEVCVAVPLLAFGGVAFVEHRWDACMGWLAPLVLVKEDLGLTVFMAGLAIAWRGRGEGRSAVLRGLAYALFGIVAFVVTVKVLLPAMNPAGTWAYSLDGSATGAGTPMGGSTAARGLPSLWDILTTPSVKLITLLVLAAGAGFVGASSPWFALVLPTLAWRFAGSVESYSVWDSWHYNAPITLPRPRRRDAGARPRGRWPACPRCLWRSRPRRCPCGSCPLSRRTRAWRPPRARSMSCPRGPASKPTRRCWPGWCPGASSTGWARPSAWIPRPSMLSSTGSPTRGAVPRLTPSPGPVPLTPATPTRPSTPRRASASRGAPRNTQSAAQR